MRSRGLSVLAGLGLGLGVGYEVEVRWVMVVHDVFGKFNLFPLTFLFTREKHTELFLLAPMAHMPFLITSKTEVVLLFIL